jgi:hypothetical protein
MRANTQLKPEVILRWLIIAGLVVNAAILITGLRPVEEEGPPVSIKALETQIDNLRKSLGERTLPSEQEAETRAVGLFRLAAEKEVNLISWNSKAVSEPLGASGQVNLLRSAVEFRGEREKLLATVDAFKELFGPNTLISDVELRGAEKSWLLRLNLTQLLTLS